MISLEPDLSWMSGPTYASVPPSQEVQDLLTEHITSILTKVHGPEAKQLDPITLAVLLAALCGLATHVVDECWERCFKRATYNPFYRRRCVRAFADQLEKKNIAEPYKVADVTLEHFRHMDREQRKSLFAAIRQA